jgi:hypothetical protein
MGKGYKQKMSDEQRRKLSMFQYAMMLKYRRGHNYEYWNEKHFIMIGRGWKLADFSPYNNNYEKYATHREDIAKHEVEVLRATRHYARIICGYKKDIQRTKYYSVIFKKK